MDKLNKLIAEIKLKIHQVGLIQSNPPEYQMGMLEGLKQVLVIAYQVKSEKE